MTSLWTLPVLRLVATDRCRAPAPWLRWARGGDSTSILRRRAAALERRALGATHSLEQAFAVLIHLPFSVVRILQVLLTSGPAVRRLARISYLRQARHLGLCAWRLGLRPQLYYQLQLHTHPDPAAWADIIDPSELHHLQRDISPSDLEPLRDKLLFAEHAFAAGLPAIPLLEIWHHGRVQPSVAADQHALDRDLFVKRTLSYGSIGVMAFHYNPTTGAHYDEQRRYSSDELADLLRSSSAQRTLLVQPRLSNHTDLAGFSSVALCNYRIVTGRYPDGRTVVIMATLRFPARSELTCAETNTTLCAAVDLDTGRLHAAGSKDPSLGQMERHPLSGQQVRDFPVPHWDELKSLALRAHEAWPDFPFIGWDISDTPEGLYLVEGGCLWGGTLAQMSGGRPLGRTAFAPIYHAHLARRANVSA